MKPILKLYIFVLGIIILLSCNQDAKLQKIPKAPKPEVKDHGLIIEFPKDSANLNFFKTYATIKENITAEVTAPARVLASVVKSDEMEESLVLFDNPDLTANYSAFLQHEINIGQYALALSRTQDLFEHGSASGKEVIEARTALSNEKAAIKEDEAKLRLAGLNPEELKSAKPGVVWLISDIPENQIGRLKKGQKCQVIFNSYPGEDFKGKIENLGEVVDNVTRMVKIRISVNNPDERLRAGMFGVVSFGLSEGSFIDIPASAIITVQGKNYVFVKKENVFERREVLSGQQIIDKVIIYSGLQEGEQVVATGTMQLKGLSFGY